MWEYWFEAIVIFMLLGISGRVFLLARRFEDFHNCFQHFEERVFSQDHEVHVDDGKSMRVMGLEQFMDEFGFDPREAETPDTAGKANTSEIDAWDNSSDETINTTQAVLKTWRQ